MLIFNRISKKKLKNFTKAFFLNIYFSLFRILEFLRLFLCFYLRSCLFFSLDIVNCFFCLKSNPYKLLHQKSKSFFRDVYGETPITTFNKITKYFGLTSNDIFYDFGCGMGRVCFWVYCFIKCKKIIGVDRCSSFILTASKIKKQFFLKENLIFLESSFSDLTIEEASFIYFYGTSFPISVIKEAIEKFLSLKSGTKIVSVTYPLHSFVNDGKKEEFIVTKEKKMMFPWGKTKVYLNIKV